MIHSLSGGVIAENGEYLFAKVRIGGAPYWYIAPFPVEAGDCVLAPFGRDGRAARGVVERTERCTRQTAPCPMNRVRELSEVLPKDEKTVDTPAAP